MTGSEEYRQHYQPRPFDRPPPPLPWDVQEAFREARRKSVYVQVSRYGGRFKLVFYAYNQVVGTYDCDRRTLTLPNPDLPPFEGVGPIRAAKIVNEIADVYDPQWEWSRDQFDQLPGDVQEEREAVPVSDRVSYRRAA